LIGFSSLRIGKLIILGFFIKGSLDCARIIFLFSLTVVVFKRAKSLLNLRIWLKEADFVDRERQWWSSYSFQGSPSFILAQKLKALKFNLIRWNTQVFGNVDSLKQARLEKLHTFDRPEAERVLDSKEKLSKSLISSDLEKITLQEEISWKQKSKGLWLKECDKCKKFFHRLANSNQRFNSIESLSVNGSVTSDPTVIRDHIVHFYDSLFSKHHNWRPRLNSLAFDSLKVEEASRLELPFKEKEVLEVVKGMNRDKAQITSLWLFFKTARM
jgi:hypothetical protein